MKTWNQLIRTLAFIVPLFTAACAATSTSGVKPYPLTTCIVTGNALDSMGEEQRIVYEGREIKFCCEPCKEKFLKNPGKYLPKIQ